jgi:hypothetical protein
MAATVAAVRMESIAFERRECEVRSMLFLDFWKRRKSFVCFSHD